MDMNVGMIAASIPALPHLFRLEQDFPCLYFYLFATFIESTRPSIRLLLRRTIEESHFKGIAYAPWTIWEQEDWTELQGLFAVCARRNKDEI